MSQTISYPNILESSNLPVFMFQNLQSWSSATVINKGNSGWKQTELKFYSCPEKVNKQCLLL